MSGDAARLFIAVNLPEEERSALWRAAEAVRAALPPVRWVPAQNVHLTLKFLGTVRRERVEAIAAALDRAAAKSRPFPLTLDGFGAFPDARRPRVFWVGVEPHPALELLVNDLEGELAALGFPLEGRPFRPHLTVGRARRDAVLPAAFSGLDALAAGWSYASSVPVASVELMQSVLRPSGATYTVRHRAPLGA